MASQFIKSLVTCSHSKCLVSSAASYSRCLRHIGAAHDQFANVLGSNIAGFHTSAVDEAARKGTRARRGASRRAEKTTIEKEGEEFIPFAQRDEKIQKSSGVDYDYNTEWMMSTSRRESFKSRLTQWQRLYRAHTVPQAVAKHRKMLHRMLHNLPIATLYLHMDLSLLTPQENRVFDCIAGVLKMPHAFPTGQENLVAVLTDCLESQARARELGAHLVAGKEVVQWVLDDTVNLLQYDFIVSSKDILYHLVPIRGILRSKFPKYRDGTAVADVGAALDRFLTGLKYEATTDLFDLDHATVQVPVGTLGMADEELQANVSAVIEDIRKQGASRNLSDLISTAYLKCSPISEPFKLDLASLAPVETPTPSADPSKYKPKEGGNVAAAS